MDVAAAERSKYEQVWRRAAYRRGSPGEFWAWQFIKLARPARGESIVDFGCGPGRAALMFERFGLDVRLLVDIAANCLDRDVAAELGARLLVAPLWDLPPGTPAADWGFCVDVMEHIPPERVDDTLAAILAASRRCFFHICLRADHFGPKLLGEPLHLTVRPFAWWRSTLARHGIIADGRDLIDNALFIVGAADRDTKRGAA